jgi:hypothetical protein
MCITPMGARKSSLRDFLLATALAREMIGKGGASNQPGPRGSRARRCAIALRLLKNHGTNLGKCSEIRLQVARFRFAGNYVQTHPGNRTPFSDGLPPGWPPRQDARSHRGAADARSGDCGRPLIGGRLSGPGTDPGIPTQLLKPLPWPNPSRNRFSRTSANS